MARRRTIKGPDGKPVEATELSFQNVREHWNEYLLDDGTVLKLKPIATEIFRLDMHDQEGNPVYFLKSHNVMVASVPDHLKKGEPE
jgi:hypothetical protein